VAGNKVTSNLNNEDQEIKCGESYELRKSETNDELRVRVITVSVF
jgi:hypothetical protein